MKYFRHHLMTAILIALFFTSTNVFATGSFGYSDYNRAQSQADKGFDDFDEEFEDEVKAPVPQHKITPIPVPVLIIAPTVEKVVSTIASPVVTPSIEQAHPTINRAGYSFTLKDCQLNSGTLLCNFNIISPTKDKYLTIDSKYYTNLFSRVFDQQGNEHHVTRMTLSNKSGARTVTSLLIAGINVKASIAIDNFNNTADIDSLALLDLSFRSDEKTYLIQYRNIAITSD